jgi:transposase-like protein
MPELLKLVTSNGTDSMREVFQRLLNEAMKIERAEALGADPYERTADRTGYANGFKPKTIQTRMGAITVEIPQVRGISFYPQSLEKGIRSERALKLAIAEMYVNGVSTRRVTEITEVLCGLDISSSQVSRVSKVLDDEVEKFRTRQLGCFPYILLDARYESVRHNDEVIDHAVLIAIGVNLKGQREVLGVSTSFSEAEVHWRDFLQSLIQRGLHGVELIVSDDHAGMKAARKAIFPNIPWQRCQFHFAQNAQSYIPKRHLREELGQALRDIFSCVTRDEARQKLRMTIEIYQKSAPEWCRFLEENIEECFAIYALPRDFHRKLRTVNGLELVNREIKRRTRVATIFPNSASCLRLVSAVLIEIHEDWLQLKMPYVHMGLRQKSTMANDDTFTIYRKKVA